MNEDELREFAYKTVVGGQVANLLNDAQLIALGKVAAEWGMLEAALNRHAMEALRLEVQFQLLTGNAHGRRVAEIFIEGAAGIFWREPKDLVTELVKCLDKILIAATKRNELLHGMWGVITESTGMHPGLPAQMGTVYRKRGAALSCFPADEAAIEQTASDIADVRLELNRIFFRILMLRRHPGMLTPPS